MEHPARVYIIGFMGSGKSTAGKKLAAMKGWKFIDLDKRIEEIAAKPIGEIFSTRGEEYFRDLESAALSELKTGTDTVISVGGGTPCFKGNMDFMLQTGLVIYLRMTPEQLRSRLEGASASRPLINNLHGNELIKFISGKLKERETFYLKASVIIDGFDLDIQLLTQLIDTE